MNDFTKGEWEIGAEYGAFKVEIGIPGRKVAAAWVKTDKPEKGSFKSEIVDWEEGQNNARLIAAAGTAASKLAEQGYAAIAVLERLPEIVDCLSALSGVVRIAIKSGDWNVDGACDPDMALSHADHLFTSIRGEGE